MLRESMKLFFSVAANEDFRLRSIYIRGAFLQAKDLDRDVYLMPPKDVRKEGYIWKLKKPLYRLNDTLGKFWLKVKNLFLEMGLKRLDGDEAIYYMINEKGGLKGMVSTCVDNFDLAATQGFVSAPLDVSKVEDDSFRFKGIYIMKV